MVYNQKEQFDSGWKRHIDASNIGLALFSLTAGFFICFLLKTNAWTRETDNIFDNTLIINDCFSMTFWTDWTKWKTPKTQVFRCFLRIYGFFRQSHFCLSYPTFQPLGSEFLFIYWLQIIENAYDFVCVNHFPMFSGDTSSQLGMKWNKDQSAPHYTMLTYIGNDVVLSFLSLLFYRYFLSPIFISDRTSV